MTFSCMTCMTVPYMYTIYADHSPPFPGLTFLVPLSIHTHPISTALSRLFCDPVSLCSVFWVSPQPEIMTSDTGNPSVVHRSAVRRVPIRPSRFSCWLLTVPVSCGPSAATEFVTVVGVCAPEHSISQPSPYFQVLTDFLLSFLLCSPSRRENGVHVYLGLNTKPPITLSVLGSYGSAFMMFM